MSSAERSPFEPAGSQMRFRDWMSRAHADWLFFGRIVLQQLRHGLVEVVLILLLVAAGIQ